MSKSDKQVEWCLDFYPKAVQFQKFCLIGWHVSFVLDLGLCIIMCNIPNFVLFNSQETTEVPEHILKTVRLSMLCRAEEDVHVHVGVLIAGSQDGVEHVRSVVQKNYIFSERDRVLNIDNLLPYGDLNPCAECVARSRLQNQNPTTSSSSSGRISQDFPTSPQRNKFGGDNSSSRQTDPASCWSCLGAGNKSCFFLGPNLDSVKIRIVITPLP